MIPSAPRNTLARPAAAHAGAASPNGTVAVAKALGDNEALASLMQRVRESRARFDAVAFLLPDGLRALARPGPIDEHGWSLLAAHGAAAAKLRQLLPLLNTALLDKGWLPVAITVRVRRPA